MADGAPAQPSVRRAATLPTRLQPPPSSRLPPAPPPPSEVEPETLFSCPSCRIVSFPSRPSTSSGRGKKLPWTDRHERVRAVGAYFSICFMRARPSDSRPTGPLELYRMGAVAFLRSREVVLTLFPRSQCWCVDGVSKFALQIKQEVYRIELPFSTETDAQIINRYQEVLSTVLRYERTQCPFERGVEDDLPEDDPSPARARQRGPVTQARKWTNDAGWRPEDMEPDEWRQRFMRGNSPGGSDDGSRTSVATDDTGATPLYSPSTAQPDDEGPQVKPLSADAYRSYRNPHRHSLNPGDPFNVHFGKQRPATQENSSPDQGTSARVFFQGASERVSVSNRVNGFSAAHAEPAPALRRSSKMIARSPRVASTPAITEVEEPQAQPQTPPPLIREPLPAAKQAKIEESITPASSTAQSDDVDVAQQVTEALERHNLHADAATPASSGSHAGLSPEPSYASLKPLPETIEAQPFVEAEPQADAVLNEQRSPEVYAEVVLPEVIADDHPTEVNIQDGHENAAPVQSESKTARSTADIALEAAPQAKHDVEDAFSPATVAPSFPAEPTTEDAPQPAIEHAPEPVTSQEHTTTAPETSIAQEFEPKHTEIPSDLNTPPLPDPRAIQPTNTMSRHRSFHTLNAKQSISLMSAHAMRRQPSISFGPSTDSSSGSDLATHFISKTVALLRGPPAGLLAVMVQIAAKIARGAFDSEATAFRYREGKRRRDGTKWMPGGWESENEDEWEEDRGDDDAEDDEDDYGVPLGCETPARQRRKDWGRDVETEGSSAVQTSPVKGRISRRSGGRDDETTGDL